MSNEKEKLLNLEKEKKYVFHGSPFKLKQLNPNQGYNYNKELNKMVEDGEPAISASPYIDIAIFRAIINPHNFPFKGYESAFGISRFRTTQKVLENLKNKKGNVYVLDKAQFYRFSNMEWRSSKKIKPIEIIQVFSNDLPENITAIDC